MSFDWSHGRFKVAFRFTVRPGEWMLEPIIVRRLVTWCVSHVGFEGSDWQECQQTSEDMNGYYPAFAFKDEATMVQCLLTNSELFKNVAVEQVPIEYIRSASA